MGRVTDRWVESQDRHRVCYSVVVKFHEDDVERLRKLVLAAPDDHELHLTDQEGQVVLGRWTCEVPERTFREQYDAVPRLLQEAGLKVVRQPWVVPGTVYVAVRAATSRLCRCTNVDVRCEARTA